VSSVHTAPSPLHRRISGLEDFWARMTRRAPPRADAMAADRLLRDALGVGIEQVAAVLGQQTPSLEDFEAWLLQTAGPPDPDRLGRYHAWLAGEPPPAAIRRRLAVIDAMEPALSPADLEAWDRDGVVILRQAIDPDEARAATSALWRTVGADPDDPASWYPPNDHGIMVQIFQHPAMEAARRSPRIHKAFAQLWGTADLWMTTDRLSFNAPETATHRFRGPHLHWDCSLATPIPFATQGILYLTDTAADQGALTLVPGFHHQLEAWLASLAPDTDPRQVDLAPVAGPVAAGAGDLVIWRQDLPHGASPNRAALPRLAQYINMYSPDLPEHPVWR
jgi:hypothetical protein